MGSNGVMDGQWCSRSTIPQLAMTCAARGAVSLTTHAAVVAAAQRDSERRRMRVALMVTRLLMVAAVRAGMATLQGAQPDK